MKTTFTTVAALALAGNAAAFWRMPCRSNTGIARIDPLVAPGDTADHSHIVFGSGNFGMETTYESLTQCSDQKHNCTSCEVVEDKSAYWTPPLYFQHADGKTEMVPNVGGMLAYYLFYLDNVQPFPEGFQMIAGYPNYRNFSGPFPDMELSYWPTDPTDQFFLQQRAIGFNCLNYAKDPEASLYRHVLPKKDYMDANCVDGLRLEMAFPSCGKKGQVDSEDHRSHMAYPSLVKEGNCPSGYDVHYPFLFYETIYATQKFAGMPGRFLVSTGDPVGASYHADFIMGWPSEKFLGQAINSCTSDTGLIQDCAMFTLQNDTAAAQCTFPMPAHLEGEDCEGPLNGLPVNVPIQDGPQPATKYPVAGAHGGQVKTSSLPATATHTTYSAPEVPYSPVHSASTPVIKAADYSASVTTAPSYPSAETHAECYTTWMTKGHEVIEMIVEETEITVTATATETAAGYGSKHKRHLEKHVHKHHAH